jgi:hypothetical protein
LAEVLAELPCFPSPPSFRKTMSHTPHPQRSRPLAAILRHRCPFLAEEVAKFQTILEFFFILLPTPRESRI